MSCDERTFGFSFVQTQLRVLLSCGLRRKIKTGREITERRLVLENLLFIRFLCQCGAWCCWTNMHGSPAGRCSHLRELHGDAVDLLLVFDHTNEVTEAGGKIAASGHEPVGSVFWLHCWDTRR